MDPFLHDVGQRALARERSERAVLAVDSGQREQPEVDRGSKAGNGPPAVHQEDVMSFRQPRG